VLVSIALGQARAQSMEVAGVIRTSRGVPIPGCVVTLVNPDKSAIDSVETGTLGDYYFSEVPTDVDALYTIEVRWGRSILYRGLVRNDGMQEPIVILAQ
jgi:hypothetical protein